MLRILLVALGGAIGTAARYGLNGVISERAFRSGSWLPIFPFGTLVVNVSGCFAVGLLAAVSGPSLGRLITLEKVRVIRYSAGGRK